MPSLMTASRATVSLDHPLAVEIRDVAHALSLICRFNGHTPVPYSVAQHSLAVSHEAGRLAQAAEFNPESVRFIKLVGLLHDAHEYLCGDVTRPVKECLGTVWHTFERRLQCQVLDALKLPAVSPAIATLVKQADDRLLSAEQFTFFGLEPPEAHQDVRKFVINPWPSTWARSKFLQVYGQLTEKA